MISPTEISGLKIITILDNITQSAGPVAHWGVSTLIDYEVSGRNKRVLLDTGSDRECVLRNLKAEGRVLCRTLVVYRIRHRGHIFLLIVQQHFLSPTVSPDSHLSACTQSETKISANGTALLAFFNAFWFMRHALSLTSVRSRHFGR